MSSAGALLPADRPGGAIAREDPGGWPCRSRVANQPLTTPILPQGMRADSNYGTNAASGQVVPDSEGFCCTCSSSGGGALSQIGNSLWDTLTGIFGQGVSHGAESGEGSGCRSGVGTSTIPALIPAASKGGPRRHLLQRLHLGPVPCELALPKHRGHGLEDLPGRQKSDERSIESTRSWYFTPLVRIRLASPR